jgi:hypothetical protein
MKHPHKVPTTMGAQVAQRAEQVERGPTQRIIGTEK